MANSSSLYFSPVKTTLPDIYTKLASGNYLLWKVQVVLVLCGHGLLSYVKNKIVCPPSTILGEDGEMHPNLAAAKWLRIEQLIMHWLNSSLSYAPLSQVISCESFHDAWDVLETLYGTHTRDRIQQMKGELQYLTKGVSSLEDYLHKAKSLALALHGAGKPIDDDDFIICILHGLGLEFDPIVVGINAREVFPPLESVISKFQVFELRISITRALSHVVAMYTNRGAFTSDFKENRGGRVHGYNSFCRSKGTKNHDHSQGNSTGVFSHSSSSQGCGV